MSVQSESGRVDYSKSDHAPKGTRMAGEVVLSPMYKDFNTSIKAGVGQMKNERTLKETSEPLLKGNVSDEFLRRKMKDSED